MALYETPSRIWRRIEDDREPSSLPSLPEFEHSVVPGTESDQTTTDDDDNDLLPIHSTPAPLSSLSAPSTVRLQSSTSSTVRFATSIASRSASIKSSTSRSFARNAQRSFDISAITSLPHESDANTDSEEGPLAKSTNSVPEAYLPPQDGDDVEDMSLVDALESVSCASSPFSPELPPPDPTPKKGLPYDYSVSLRSEAKPSPAPMNKYRNVALRRPLARTRTPSLSRSTSSSSASSPPNSTPRSNRTLQLPVDPESPTPGTHIPLPRSASASPAVSLPSVVIQPPDEDLSLSRTSDEEQDMFPQEHEHDLESEPDKASTADDNPSSDREPTFSSASSDPSYPTNRTIQPNRSPVAPSTAFPSPAPSTAFTPTPAATLRRARFNLPPPPEELYTQDEMETDSEPVTPHTRRRSFLLSVINSTARPRMKAGTPHPHRRLSALPIHNETSTDVQATPGVSIQKTFGGITPRPRRGRMSHPLAQTYLPEVSEAGDGENANDSASERGSVISTTSSQDLVTHVRANTSYDPALGLGERGKMSRFDAQKLNSYLHGLNRRLQEENTDLVARLQKYEEVKHGPRLSMESAAEGRRLSVAGSLGDVEEEAGEEGWAEERLELEARVQKTMEDLEQAMVEKGQMEKDLEKERSERARDKERWKVRMEEVESGVGEIVSELESRVEEAESMHAEALEGISKIKREAERMRDQLETERDLALERAAKADSALESGKELGGALKEANSKISSLSSDLQVATAHIRDLEEERSTLDQKARNLEQILGEEKASSKLANEEATSHIKELEAERTTLDRKVRELEHELKEEKVSSRLAEEEATSHIKELEEDLMTLDRNVRELEQDLKEEKLSSKLAEEEFHSQLSEMGTEVMRATARISELQNELAERDTVLDRLEGELQTKSDELFELQRCADQDDKETAREMQALKSYIAELEERSEERVKDLREQLARAQDRIDQFEVEEEQSNDRMEMLEKEAERASELARQLEDALEAAEEKMKTDEEMLAGLKARVSSLEREQERQREQPSNHDEEEALEAELDEAHKEIARLNALLQQSPARKAIDKARDTRIELLEREKEELMERVKSLKSSNAEMATPKRVMSMSGISPIHRHVLSMSVKAPKTPGAPLGDLSWLNATTADPTVSPLLTEIARLQTELDLANESIDQKLDELQEAGLDVVDLTKNLEDARGKIVTLESETARLQRREERRLRRLEKLRCQKCWVKIDASRLQRIYEADESSLSLSLDMYDELPSNPPTPPSKAGEALRVELQNVNAELDTMKKRWQEEKRQLLGEKAVLQDTANRMSIEIRNAKQEAKKAVDAERESHKAIADTQEEVGQTKAAIADLEAELQAERMRLRQMSTQQDRLQREIGDVARELQRTETDMEDVKRQLQKAKQENHELEKELRVDANAEQKARLLDAKVRENTSTIEQLRQERSILARDHKDLQVRYAAATERANKLRNEYSASHKSHENRRQQLDIHLAEIEELRRALANQADELQRTEQEKNRIVMEKNDVERTIAAFEADLKRVRKDAEIFGRDLKALRVEKAKSEQRQKEEIAKAERTKKQAQTQVRLLTDQLESQKAKVKKMQLHVCSEPSDGLETEELKAQHKQECKGLIVQIRYLKAKFTRESTLRDDLSYQKRYLLVLLASFEASEKRILACISQIGYPKQPPSAVAKKPRSFKSTAWSIIFIRRAKAASDAWRDACSNKQAIVDALQEVRRRRLTVTSR